MYLYKSKSLEKVLSLLKIEKVFRALNESDIKYVLIGGLASIVYGVPRTTVDIDIAIEPTEKNIKKVIKTLSHIGLTPEISEPIEILGVGGTTFENELEIDVLTDVPNIAFSELWEKRKIIVYKKVKLPVISLELHIALLRKIGRKKDLEDVKYLEKPGEL